MKLRNEYVRHRMLAIPISGVILTLATLAPGLDTNPASNPDGFARAAITSPYEIANLAGLVGVVILLFGFQALHACMSGTKLGKWAFVGMVTSTAGMGLFLPFLGIFAFAAPTAARLYLDGDEAAMSIVVNSVSPTSLPTILFGGLLILMFLLGSATFAVCIWRSGKLPKWSALPYAAVPLFTLPLYSFAVAFMGSVMLLISGLWFVASVWRRA